MILKIVGKGDKSTGRMRLDISLHSEDRILDTYEIEDFTGQFSASHLSDLKNYFSRANASYLSMSERVTTGVSKFGAYLGDQLLGEDFQLNRAVSKIEEFGFHELTVVVEAEDMRFQQQLWEALVLDESSFFLATQVKGFLRNTSGAAYSSVELRHGLASSSEDESLTMNVVDIIGRSMDELDLNDSSLALSRTLQSHPRVKHELFLGESLQDLESMISRMNQVHVMHYDGPVDYINDKWTVLIGKNNVPLEEFSALLEKYKISCVFAEVLKTDSLKTGLDNSQHLNQIFAQELQKHGVKNIVSTFEGADSEARKRTYDSIYEKLNEGLSLAQAVVESRKTLFSMLSENNFMCWPILTHYSQQDVVFFDSAVQENSDASGEYRKNVYGFDNEIIEALNDSVCDKQAYEIVRRLPTYSNVEVVGSPGAGKSFSTTQACFALAATELVDYAFNFDLSKYIFESSDVFQMIKPVVGDGSCNSIDEVLDRYRCCFVFDNSQVLTQDDKAHISSLIAELSKSGSYVILVGNEPQDFAADQAVVSLGTKDISFNRKYNFLKKHLNYRAGDFPEEHLIEIASVPCKNFWALERRLSMAIDTFNTSGPDKAAKIIQQPIQGKNDIFEYACEELDVPLKRLVAYLGLVKGLLIEMYSLGLQGKEADDKLLQALGIKERSILDIKNSLLACGVLKLQGGGHIIDPAFVEYLNANEPSDVNAIDDGLVLGFYSHICESLIRLSAQILKQQNPTIVKHLMDYRWQWAKVFEFLWTNKQYPIFFRVLAQFRSLMQMAEIHSEYSAWIYSLVEGGAFPKPDDKDEEYVQAWFMLLTDALEDPKALESESLNTLLDQWLSWYEDVELENSDTSLPLFNMAYQALIVFNLKKKNWSSAASVGTKASEIFIKHKAWKKAISTYKSLISCYKAMGDDKQVSEVESKLLHEVPYEEFPNEIHVEQIIWAVGRRLSDEELDGCQELIEKAVSYNIPQFSPLLEGLQSELHIKNKEYEKALPYLCKKWLEAIAANYNDGIEKLRVLMLQIDSALGREEFTRLFQESVPQGTALPYEQTGGLH